MDPAARVVQDSEMVNPYFGYCTLACCKPNIRRQATVGDLVVGCGSAALDLRGHVIFAMRVTETLSFQEYWDDPRFARKRPLFTAGKARAYGDSIYHRDDVGNWIQEDSHHSFTGGEWNAANAERDLSTDAVLISSNYAYWGRSAPAIPALLRNFDGEDLYADVRDYRRRYSNEFKAVVAAWFDQLPKGRFDRPISWK
jgi:hypothetical protein